MTLIRRRSLVRAAALVGGVLTFALAPVAALAATVTLTANTSVVLPSDGSSYTLSNGGTFDQLAVSGGTMTFTMSSGESVTITAPTAGISLFNDGNFTTDCGANPPLLILSVSGNTTVNVTPAAGCGGSSSSSSSVGGGSSTTAVATVATSTTATTTVPMAKTTPVKPATPASGLTSTQISAILGLLQSFNADASVIASVKASLGAPGIGGVVSTAVHLFQMDRSVGSVGADVKTLQQYLNSHGYPVSNTGSGSSGSETTTFGAKTKAALAKLQAAAGITPAAGYFGPKTRAYIEAHP